MGSVSPPLLNHRSEVTLGEEGYILNIQRRDHTSEVENHATTNNKHSLHHYKPHLSVVVDVESEIVFGEERRVHLLVLQLAGHDGAVEYVVEEQVRQLGLVPLQLLRDLLGKALEGLV